MKKSQREKDITKVSTVGIISNGLLGVIKVFVGITTHSIAIITDAVNNLTDTSSSIITIIGTHLATRRPNAKHPFGFGRVEYLTSLVIGLLVAFTGFELCKSSVDAIIHPHHVSYNMWSAIILAATVVVKIFLGQYTLKAGNRLDSEALKASGMDARSDAVATTAALLSVLLFMWKHISIDAWVGAVISLYIIRTGYQILKSTISKLVGEAPSQDIAQKIYAKVRAVPIVKGAYDLVLNSYGPDFYVGSINVEVDYNLTAEEICRTLHPVQVEIQRDLRTSIVFGLYAVDTASPHHQQFAQIMADFCKQTPGCQSCHGLFVDDKSKQVFADVVAGYDANHTAIEDKLVDYLTKSLPGYTPMVNIDSPS